MNTSQIAAQLFTVRNFTKTAEDFAQTMKKLKDIGYDAVQISAIGPIDYREVKQIADSLDIKICATHSPFQRMREDLANLIREHQMWGCDYIGLGSLPPEFRGSYENAVAFTEIINPIAKEVAKSGLKLVYHNHKFEFEKHNGKNLFEVFEDHTDPKELGFLIDTFWLQAGGASPTAFIEQYADRIEVVHLKDMQVIKDEAVMAEVGEGNMDWQSIIKACGDIRVQWYAVEQDVCRRDPFESLAISLAHIKKWCGE